MPKYDQRPKFKVVGRLIGDEPSNYRWSIPVGEGINARTLDMPVKVAEPNPMNPTRLEEFPGSWLFRSRIYNVLGEPRVSEDELILRLKHFAIREEKALERIQREVQAFENLETVPTARRERIPESVRLFVWQRDQGKCVKCERNEHLEFDHVIPVVMGGGNTERNIQLLCERCNREKGKTL